MYLNCDMGKHTLEVILFKKLGLDTQKIKKCQEEEAIELAKEELRLTGAFGVSGSPTVFIDGELHQEPRIPAGYQKTLCSKFEVQPRECENLPESEEVIPTGGCG